MTLSHCPFLVTMVTVPWDGARTCLPSVHSTTGQGRRRSVDTAQYKPNPCRTSLVVSYYKEPSTNQYHYTGRSGIHSISENIQHEFHSDPWCIGILYFVMFSFNQCLHDRFSISNNNAL